VFSVIAVIVMVMVMLIIMMLARIFQTARWRLESNVLR
jgi:hypothetical protein